MKEFHITEGLPTGSHWTWPLEKGKPIIVVDFDHTITDGCVICDGGCAELQDGVINVLRELHKTYKIVIFTGYQEKVWEERIRNFLVAKEVPFDEIILGKPQACFIIDDRAIWHRSWKETLEQVKERSK